MKNLEGVVSLLDENYEDRLEQLWAMVHSICGWAGNSPLDVPHFSYHVAEAYDHDSLSAALAEICAKRSPFEVRTAGLGIFTAPKPVIYISLIKDAQMINMHSEIWERLKDLGKSISPFYAPDAWMPHITLAYEDLDPHMIGCVIEQFAYQSFDWTIPVNNLAMFGQTNPDGERPLIRYPFKG